MQDPRESNEKAQGRGCASCKWLIDWPLCHAFLSGLGIPEGVKNVWFQDVHLSAEDRCTRYAPAGDDESLSEEEMEERLRELREDSALDGADEWCVANMIHRGFGWEALLELLGRRESFLPESADKNCETK